MVVFERLTVNTVQACQGFPCRRFLLGLSTERVGRPLRIFFLFNRWSEQPSSESSGVMETISVIWCMSIEVVDKR